MKLGGMFGSAKQLAPRVTLPPAENKQQAADPGPGDKDAPPTGMPDGQALAQLTFSKRKPGDFGIVWPKVKPQKMKDYRAITTTAELEAELDRCIATGVCGFDWETTASKETKERWKAWLQEFDYQGRKDKFLDEAEEERADGRRRLRDLELEKMTKKQREAAAKKLNKETDSRAKEWESKAAELDKEYTFQLEVYRKTPLDPHQGEICTASICSEPHRARVIPIDHSKGKIFEPMLTREAARKVVMDMLERKIFRNKGVRKIAVNLAFETKYAAKYAKYIQKPVSDPLVAWVRCMQLGAPEKIKDPKKPNTGWGLKPATLDVFGVQMGNFEEMLQRHGVDFFDEIDASQGEGLTYSAEDADYAVQHDLYWMEVARQIPRYEEWLNNIEMPFGRVIGIMEYWGMRWDADLAEQKRQEAIAAQAAYSDEIKQLVLDALGMDVDPGKGGKTGDMKAVIFDHMKLPVAKLGDPTKKGERLPSLDEEALIDMEFMLQHKLHDLKEEKYLAVQLPDNWEEIDPDTDPHLSKDEREAIRLRRRDPHPFQEAGIRLLQIMKKIQKQATLLSSHIEGRGKYQNPVTGRIHCNYTPWTETARLNASKPNGQNTPRLDNDVYGVRNMYIPGVGKILFFIDFSGFELRIMAWRANDEVMIELFNTGGDMHKKTAAEMTGKDEGDVTKTERTDAKPANFGICYGGTEHALQKTFKTDYGMRKTLDECLHMVNAVKRAYPGIPLYQREVVTAARDSGYAETIHGYKRLLPNINSSNKYESAADGRRAGNTPIQGTAADVMKDVQNDVYDMVAEGTAARFDFFDRNPVMDEADQFELHMIGQEFPMHHGHTDMAAQVHDEVIFELDDNPDVVEAVYRLVKNRMEQPPIPGFPVKIEAEGSVGYSWGSKRSVESWLEEKRGA